MKKHFKIISEWAWDISISLIYGFLLVTLVFFIGKNTRFIFDSRTKYLTFNELPIELKNDILEFEQTAKQYNVDVSKIKNIKYVLVYSSKLNFGGFSGVNSIFLNLSPENEMYVKQVLWHELGHQVLNYGHDLRDATPHIMNSGSSKFIYSSWEEKKRSFFTEPMPRNYIKNSLKGMSSNNYFLSDIRDSYYNPIATYFSIKYQSAKIKTLKIADKYQNYAKNKNF